MSAFSPPPYCIGHQVAKATSVADEALGNIHTVRAFAMEDKESRLAGVPDTTSNIVS